MESTVVGGTLFLDGEWESICRLFTVDQETDFASSSFLTHHHHHQDDSNNGDGSLPLLTSQYNVSTTDPSNSKFDNVLEPVGNHLTPPSSNDLSQVSSISADTTTATAPFDLGCHFQTDQFSCLQPFMDFLSIETNKDDDDGSLFFTFPPDCDSISEQQLGTPMVDAGSSNHRLMMHNADELVKPQQATLTPKKRARASKDSEKGKRKISEKKRKESIMTTTDEGEPGKTDSNNNGQSSSCTDKVIISHNESNAASLEDNDGSETSVTLNGKKIRANRGAATDPQSLYARKRRERINERLRILQNLVPNGTKVDISTMLEEAVHYVKFLQLQIKLLSSDDMWMYSPLAYNGYDINLCSSFSPYVMKS